jgi:hypothetical protein
MNKVNAGMCTGVVTKEFDAHRMSLGEIEVTERGVEGGVVASSALANVRRVVFSWDNVKDRTNSKLRILSGDIVSFEVVVIPGTGYARAHAIVIKMTKREKTLRDQIEQFKTSGAEREQGVIETIKGDFGFIKGADRSDQLFFRLEDVNDKDGRLPNEVNNTIYIHIIQYLPLVDKHVHIDCYV